MRIIEYFSRCLTAAELNYHTSEKEFLCGVRATEHWRNYLIGRLFYWFTDHQPLTYLLTKKDISARLERWLIRMDIFQFKIIYKKGSDNIVADFLSRLPSIGEFDPDESKNNTDQIIRVITDESSSPEIIDETISTEIEEPPHMQINEDDSNISPDISIAQAAAQIAENPTSAQPNMHQIILKKQQEDADIAWLKDLIEKNKETKPQIKGLESNRRKMLGLYEQFEIIDDIIYRVNEDHIGLKSYQIVIPENMVEPLLKKIHSDKYNGHFGNRKTFKKMSDRFYSPELRQLVINYIKSCDVCQKIKKNQWSQQGEIQPIVTTRACQIVATDLSGAFPITKRGNQYILHITDLYIKILVLVAIPNKTTKVVAEKILQKWFWVYGIPEQVHSDQGKEFASQLWDAICNLLDVERTNTTPYHPQCDGQAERSVQTTK
jgi:hypothetical protein